MTSKHIKQLIKLIVAPPIIAVKGMLRRRQLSSELKHVTRDLLIDDLEALDLSPETVLLVHTSLKRLGFVEGGPASVIDALAEVVMRRRNGTLALPTFSIDGTMHNTLSTRRVFDVRSTPSNLGAIPEMFRQYPGVWRSIHPTHSISALGNKAEWITRDHHVCGSNFGKESPMTRIMEAGGYLAGLGTDLGTVTFYHCLEDLETDFPISVYSNDSPFPVTCIDWNGISHLLEFQAHAPERANTRIDRKESEAIRSFFTKRLEDKAGLRWFRIGQNRGWIVPLQDMYAECLRLMQAGITIYTSDEELVKLKRSLG